MFCLFDFQAKFSCRCLHLADHVRRQRRGGAVFKRSCLLLGEYSCLAMEFGDSHPRATEHTSESRNSVGGRTICYSDHSAMGGVLADRRLARMEDGEFGVVRVRMPARCLSRERISDQQGMMSTAPSGRHARGRERCDDAEDRDGKSGHPLREAVNATLRSVTKLGGSVAWVAPPVFAQRRQGHRGRARLDLATAA
jgi:hypothetical protein